jgi:hypothetical protein
MNEIAFGYCHCGCGKQTKISARTHRRYGWVKGEPLLFINGHQSRGENHARWNGGKRRYAEGYIGIKVVGHPRANKSGYVGEHILVAEKALGKYLPINAVVHHINGDKSDNRNENLLICENQQYHSLIHRRTRAFEASGHADWRKCWMCKTYDDPKNLRLYPSQSGGYHAKCKHNKDYSMGDR